MLRQTSVPCAFHEPLLHPSRSHALVLSDNLTCMRQAKELLDSLKTHMTQEPYTCRLVWREGTVALWDNAASIHRASNDYDGFRREMTRTTVAGDVPR